MNQQNRIQFGSLEQQELQRIRQQINQDAVSEISTRATSFYPGQSPVHPPIPAIIGQNVETVEMLEFTQSAMEEQKRTEENQRKYELDRQARQILVPTQEQEVKSYLRQMGHPVTYFGESAAQRRERLKKTMTDFFLEYGRMFVFEKPRTQMSAMRDMENQYFLYEGKESLRENRIKIALYSLKKSAVRIEKSRLRRLLVDALEEDREFAQECAQACNFEVQMSQFADTSCVSRGEISPNQLLFASAGGTGDCKIWNINDTHLRGSLLGHLTKVHSLAFHPQSTLGLSPASLCNIATASSDLSIRLWSLDLENETSQENGAIQQSFQIKGHEDRVNKVIFHHGVPNLLFSTSHDRTWRLWDIETSEEVLCQTGHSKAVYAGALHPDGSLFFSGDLGGAGMIWDLRTGKSVIPIIGHVKGILCSDFSCNGYQLATGGDDNHMRIWDLRRKGPLEKIPAHIKVVSDVKFQPEVGKYLSSCSYDGTVKIWNTRDWSLQQTYKGHESKLTSLSITKDLQYMITTAIDRNFVVWKKQIQEKN